MKPGNSCLIVIFLGLLAFTSWGKDSAVAIKIDYQRKQLCGYGIDYLSQGNFKQNGKVSTKSTTVFCRFTAANVDGKRLAVQVDSAAVASDVYSQALREEIHDNLMQSRYSLSMDRGFPAIDSFAKAPLPGYLEWDLYRQLLKLLPVLPDKPIRPGYTWERFYSLPLHTVRGHASCDVYRFYTFNGLRGDSATISWKFRYSANKNAYDSIDAMDQIPVSGNGFGSAIIDVRNHCLLSGQMDFVSPVAVIGNVDVTWKEHAAFKLIECK